MARRLVEPKKTFEGLDWTDDFDKRVIGLSSEWSGPLIDVIDTLDSVVLALERYGFDENADAAIELTKLVLERHDKQKEKEDD